VPLPEKAIIARIRNLVGRQAGRGNSWVLTGIGDDCAVLRPKPGRDILITTDFSIEGTHFRREWHPADSVGHRCLARGLSDIAAMGGEPQAAFLSLALPRDLPQKWVDGFLRGFLKLAKQFSVSLAGGDISESQNGVLADVMVVGSAAKGGAILRSGARPGDLIYVTGDLGASRATLELLLTQGSDGVRPQQHRRHFYPQPRIEVGAFLQKKRLATSMIDLSDGLSTDLAHICEESGVGAIVDKSRIPIAPQSNVDFALHGGEDYELLFTARPGKKIPSIIKGVKITEIGRITREKKLLVADKNGKIQKLKSRGWEHFER
jgi:thiamine-monophosphate kinase